MSIQYYIFSKHQSTKCKPSLKVDGETISIVNPKHSCESRAIISDDVRKTARKIEEKALELASNSFLTADSIYRQLSIQAFISNEEFYRVPSKKKIEALVKDFRASGKKNDLSEIKSE
ncbi:hypothetical protein HZS_185, partial [Henneguya salminicola]